MVKIIISAGGTVPTQQYGNYQPTYTLEEEFDSKDPEAIESRMRDLRDIAERMYRERDGRFRDLLTKVKEQNKEVTLEDLNIRWYEKDGKKYPSVTSIINPEGLILTDRMIELGMTMEDIDIYGDRGTIVHEQAEHFLKTGEWMEAEDHELFEKVVNYRSAFVTDERVIDPRDCNFRGFMDKHGPEFQFNSFEQEVIDTIHGFGGRYDADGLHETVDAMIDYKTASSYPKEKLEQYFKQMAAYDIATGSKKKRYVIIPLKPNNKCGFGKPIITEAVEIYRNLFLEDLTVFKQKYGHLYAN